MSVLITGVQAVRVSWAPLEDLSLLAALQSQASLEEAPQAQGAGGAESQEGPQPAPRQGWAASAKGAAALHPTWGLALEACADPREATLQGSAAAGAAVDEGSQGRQQAWAGSALEASRAPQEAVQRVPMWVGAAACGGPQTLQQAWEGPSLEADREPKQAVSKGPAGPGAPVSEGPQVLPQAWAGLALKASQEPQGAAPPQGPSTPGAAQVLQDTPLLFRPPAQAAVPEQPRAARQPNPGSPPARFHVFVGNLPCDASDAALLDTFRAAVLCCDARVMRDHATGRSKGFGFVSFPCAARVKPPH